MSTQCLLCFVLLFGSICALTTGPLRCSFRDGDSCGWENDKESGYHWDINYYHTYVQVGIIGTPTNSSARAVSPRYDRDLSKDGCFSFLYKMVADNKYNKTTALRVYQKPYSMEPKMLVELSDVRRTSYLLFEIWGDLGEREYTSVLTLMPSEVDFHIMIEGIYSLDRMYMSINDVAILQGSECTAAKSTASTPDSMFYEYTPTASNSTNTLITKSTPTTTPIETTTTTSTPSTTTTPRPTTTPPSSSKARPLGPDDRLSCEFPMFDFCGWQNDRRTALEWYSNHKPEEGSYIYYTSSSYPDKPKFDTVRLISPLYDRVLSNDGCFAITYKLYSVHSSKIQVYQLPEYITLQEFTTFSDAEKKNFTIFEVKPDWKMIWHYNVTKLVDSEYNFQIVIEGTFDKDYVHIAIDNVNILQGSQCDTNATTTTSEQLPTTVSIPTTTIPSPTTVHQTNVINEKFKYVFRRPNLKCYCV